MRKLLVVFFLLTTSLLFAQSYVDSGIRHFAVGEYDEALIDFKDAEAIESMITESSKAKLYYYRGLIWLDRAEKSGDFAEEDPLRISYQDLTKVLTMDNSWEPQVKEAYGRLNRLILKEAEVYTKLVKKEDQLERQLNLLDSRIQYLQMAKELEISSMSILYLGQTNKQAGDLIFESSSTVSELQKARGYYEESLTFYEQARYDDPFSKDIIRDLLTISERLMDNDRVEEYQKLLQIAGG